MSSSASSWENVTGTVASVTQLVSGIAMVSSMFIKQSLRSARLERAKKIHGECENFLLTLKTDEISRIERHQPTFMDNMGKNLQEAKTHHDHLASLTAADQGLLKEVNYWGDIYMQISELLKRLEDLKREIATTTNAYRNAPSFTGGLPQHHMQSGVGPGPPPSIISARSTDSGGMQRPLLYPRDSLQSTSSSSQSFPSNDSMHRSFTYPPPQSQPIPIPGLRTSHSSMLEPPALSRGGTSPASTHTSTDSWHTAPQSYTSPQLTNRHTHSQTDSDRAPYSSGTHMSQPPRSSRYETTQNLTDYRNPYSSGREVSPARRSYEPSQARADYSSRPPPRSSADNDESSRGVHPLYASTASTSNTAPGYNSQRHYSADSSSHSQTVSKTIPRTNTYDSRSGSNTYHHADNPRYSSASTAAKQSRSSDQAVSRNADQDIANLSLQSMYISSGPTASQSVNRRQSSFIPSSSTVASNPVSHHPPTTHYEAGFNPLATADASTRRQSSFIAPSATGVLTSASQRRPTSHYDPSFRALATEVDDDSEDVSGQRFSSASSSATARQNQIYRAPSQNFPVAGSYNDRGSADQNYASGNTSTRIPPSTEDPQRVQRSFSSTSHTSSSSTHQGSSRSGQYTTHRSPQDNTPPTSRESRPVSYAQHRSRRDDYDDDSSDEDDDIYDNRTHRQEWANQVPYGSVPAPGVVSAARPHHPVSGGATPRPARPSGSTESWQDENERQQRQRSSAFYYPPPRPPSFHQQTSISNQGVTMASASSYAQHQQPANNYSSIPANTSASSYAQQTGISTQGVTMPPSTSASSYSQHQQPASNYPSMPANTSASSYPQQYGQQHYPSSGNPMYPSSASQQAQARSPQAAVIPRPTGKNEYDEHYGYRR